MLLSKRSTNKHLISEYEANKLLQKQQQMTNTNEEIKEKKKIKKIKIMYVH